MIEPATNDTGQKWDEVYGERFMTQWWPNEDIVRFAARMIRKRLTYDRFEIKRAVHSVLDLGCGNGRHVVFFGQQGLHVAGIDISATAIEIARDWCSRERIEADLQVADINHLPFEDGSFDAVVCHGVLDHVVMDQAQRAVEEVHRVLSSRGLFYCDLRSAEDMEAGDGEEVARNTYLIGAGYEEGLVQHFFARDEIDDLFSGLFGILNLEAHEHRVAPDFDRKYSRWVLALEKVEDKT